MKKNIIAILIGLLLFNSLAWSWSENTHVILTDSALKEAILKNRPYLLHQMGMVFNEGHPLKNNDLLPIADAFNFSQWLKWGAMREDYTPDFTQTVFKRSNNHFHNPLNTFQTAGLSDIQSGLSSIVWAQSPNEQDGFFVPDGDNTWQKARETFHLGLVEKVPEKRRKHFAHTFKALGHQAHLIQDMAVPDHVRNDAHVLNSLAWGIFSLKHSQFRCIEGWAVNNPDKISQFASAPVLPGVNLNEASVDLPDILKASISRLSDVDEYKGVIPSNSNTQGLAEYTNANYFSEDTIFRNFPHPSNSPEHVEEYAVDIDFGDHTGIFKKWYYKKRQGQTLEHLACLGFFKHHIQSQGYYISLLENFLDNTCHEEYCSHLVPRAVGSSIAVFDYFFRGQIELKLPDDGIYAFCDENEPVFTKIKLKARNATPDEDMKAGEFKLVIRYRDGTAAPLDQDVATPVDVYADEKYLILDCPVTTLPKDEYAELTFDLSETPISINAIDLSLSLVFKGELGAERDAVAFGYKDISEPTPLAFYNYTDYVCVSQDGVTGFHQLGDEVLQGIENDKICIFEPFIIKPWYVAFNGSEASASNYYKMYTDVQIQPNNQFVMYVLGDADKKIKRSLLVSLGRDIPHHLSCDKIVAYMPTVKEVTPYQNTVKIRWQFIGDEWKPISDFLFYRLRKTRGRNFWVLSYYDLEYPPFQDFSCDSDFFIDGSSQLQGFSQSEPGQQVPLENPNETTAAELTEILKSEEK